METWIWISLYVVQTLVGAVLWRKYIFNNDTPKFSSFDNAILSLWCSLINPVAVPVVVLAKALINFITYLESIKKTEENDNI